MKTSRHFFGKSIRTIAAVISGVLLVIATANGQESSPLGGVWTLNRALSEMPREIGFNVDWMPPPEPGRAGGSGGTNRGRRSGGGGGGSATSPYSAPRESFDDAQRIQLLTAEVRNPPTRLMIVDTPAAITITNQLGQSRTLRPSGNDEWIDVEGMTIRAATQRQSDRLVVTYRAAINRDVRYTYSASRDHQQLTIDVEFLEHGSGDKARLVYQAGIAETTSTTPVPAPPTTPVAAVPTSGGPPSSEKFDARPGAELRGLKALGILVEDLSTQAVACGLNRDALETALSARLTSGGFAVRKNSDEDTYLYVNVMTTTIANGTCVSRYDAFLYTHATANVSYRDQPVLVQVSLIHRGGIATSAPASHSPTVTRGLENYVDLFVTQIRDANK
jgi:hypothetical protein